MNTGDIQKHTERLRKFLKKAKYNTNLTFKEFTNSNPMVFLQLFHHIMIDFNEDFYKHLIDKDFELFSKNDYRFIEVSFKFMHFSN